MESLASARFAAGSTIVRRDIFDGKVWSAWPGRVIHDTEDELAWFVLPGSQLLSETSYTQARETGHKPSAGHIIALQTSGAWELSSSTIGGGGILAIHTPDSYYSVMLFFESTGQFDKWYVNFERPYQRTRIGIDIHDLALDLIIEPDLTHRWKDVDDYDQRRRAGLVSDSDHIEVQRARGHILQQARHEHGPFRPQWTRWRPSPDWSLPVLPVNATTLPTRR